MNWKPRPLSELEQAIDRLRIENIKLRREIESKQGHMGRLKVLLHQRSDTIDELHGRIEQLQERNRRLDEEAESYVAIIQRGPLRDRY